MQYSTHGHFNLRYFIFNRLFSSFSKTLKTTSYRILMGTVSNSLEYYCSFNTFVLIILFIFYFINTPLTHSFPTLYYHFLPYKHQIFETFKLFTFSTPQTVFFNYLHWHFSISDTCLPLSLMLTQTMAFSSSLSNGFHMSASMYRVSPFSNSSSSWLRSLIFICLSIHNNHL